MKLFPKLALTVSALLVSATAALSTSFYLSEKSSLQTAALQECRNVVQNLALITEESLLADDDLLLVKYVRWIQAWNPGLESASVMSTTGEILAHTDPLQRGRSTSAPLFPSGQLTIRQPVTIGGIELGSVVANFSKQHLEAALKERLQHLQKRLAWVAFAAVVTGSAFSFWIALSWTHPVATLARLAQEVGRGHYVQPVSSTSSRRDELGALARAFQSMARELQELDRMKEDFVSAVTHELRSPLGAIESYLNLINQEAAEGVSSANWKTYIERLRINTRRLTQFVNDLLDVSALERGKVALKKESVWIPDIFHDLRRLYEIRLAERNLNCVIDVPSSHTERVVADADKIRQVIENLLSNAIKFTPDGGSILMGIEDCPNRTVRVFIQDSGIGISAENQRKIFNKFEQIIPARKTVKGPKGTGLGLAICRAIVQEHRGVLEVTSQPGEGSCFAFTLPAGGPEGVVKYRRPTESIPA